MVFDLPSTPSRPTSTLVIGHRGAAGLRPENTLPSFSLAAQLQVAAVELDVHQADGQLVVIHDDSLERTTSGRGSVAECTIQELRLLDAGMGATVPLLQEVFELLPETIGINVELKGAGTAQRLAEFLPAHRGRDVLVSSFDHQMLTLFHQLRPEIPVAPLFQRWPRDAWRVAKDLGAWSVNLALRIVTPRRVTEAHRRGYRVLVYTVNDLDVAQRLVAAGVDGLFTDYPDRITLGSLSG